MSTENNRQTHTNC